MIRSFHLIDSSVHTHSSPALRSLRTDSIISYRTSSFPLLLLAGWWLSCSCRYFPPPKESQNCTHFQKRGIFLLIKPRDIWRPEENFARQLDRSLQKPITPDMWESYRYTVLKRTIIQIQFFMLYFKSSVSNNYCKVKFASISQSWLSWL